MEDKMRREKNKNRASDEPTPSPTEPPTALSSEGGTVEGEDDPQSLNNAIQSEELTTNAAISNYLSSDEQQRTFDDGPNESEEVRTVIISTSQPNIANGQNHRPKVQVESEKVEVIEIRSDGSSGHLVPGRDSWAQLLDQKLCR